jgi:putative ABC transport system permease protein
MRLTLPRDKYPGEGANAFFAQLSERISAIAGVRSVATSSQFAPRELARTQFRLERAPAIDGDTLPTAVGTVASPGYFATLGVTVRAGRDFSAGDRLDTPPVAVVNQAFVARYVKEGDPIGQRLALGSPNRERPWRTIVGVVADFKNTGLTDPVAPAIYTPVAQQTDWNQLFVLVRSEVAAPSLLPHVRRTVMSLDPDQPIYFAQTIEDALATATFQQRASALLVGVFAAVALVLAAVGTYGVMSYVVSTRTQEMGVRLAVGARPRDVMWLVLGQVLRLVAIGLAVGIPIVLAGGTALENLLFGVRAADPLTIALVSALLAAVALLAAWVPAARAGRVDPIRALRVE